MDFLNIIGTLFDNSINHVVALANLIKDLRLNKNQQDINEDLYELISISKNTKEKCKGYFDDISELTQYISSPEVGDWAIVRDQITGKCYVYNCIEQGIWNSTEQEYETPEIDMSNYTKKTDFKTINNLSIIGEGNIQISGGEGGGSGDGFEIYAEYRTIEERDLDKDNVPIGKIIIINSSNSEDSNLYLRTDNLEDYPSGFKPIGNFEELETIKGPKGDAFTYDDFTQELLSNLITLIENNIKNKDTVNHIFLTQVEYDALTTYEKDTLYIIVEHESSGGSSSSRFGDTFPFVLGGPVEPTLLGGKFPITLD